MAEEGKSTVLPGEWALEKALGPLLDEVGTDFKKLYIVGRDKIIEVAKRKMRGANGGLKANLRVTRDVFWNGSYTDEPICAEYFGGILASSISADGTNDSGIFYLDIIKSLSSGQLKMHYILYRALNLLLLADPNKKELNPAQGSALAGITIFIASKNILNQLGSEDVAAILHGLESKGLVGNSFESKAQELEDGTFLPYIGFSPSSIGIQLFAVANNMFPEWMKYSTNDFGDFKDVVVPSEYAESLPLLLDKAKLIAAS